MEATRPSTIPLVGVIILLIFSMHHLSKKSKEVKKLQKDLELCSTETAEMKRQRREDEILLGKKDGSFEISPGFIYTRRNGSVHIETMN